MCHAGFPREAARLRRRLLEAVFPGLLVGLAGPGTASRVPQ